LAYGAQIFWRSGVIVNRRDRRENVLVGTLLVSLLLALFFSPIWLGIVIPYIVWRSNMWLPQWI
jgi:dolichyl-phosphate-mannose--protein O-mannosyl transferase